MATFAPALPAGATVQAYADGAPGIRQSLEAMSLAMRKGRLDPGVRGWALQCLKDAGIDGRSGTTVKQQATVILDALRAATVYAPDPYGAEYIPSAAATLCLRPNLCVNGEDCDGLSVALGSLLLSIGIPVQIVKQNFGGDNQEHVLIAFYDGTTWVYADPSTKMPIGSALQAQEVWIDPMGPVGPLPEVSPEIVTLGKPRGMGSILGYPTTSDAHQLLDVAIYNAGQLKLAWDNCNSCTGASSTTCGWPDPGTTNISATGPGADAWKTWQADCGLMIADLNTLTTTWNSTAPVFGQTWDYNPELWDSVRAIIDRQIDLDKRFRTSGTNCALPTYSNEPQPDSNLDPDIWVYKDADTAIKGVESVARNVVKPLAVGSIGVVVGVTLAIGGFFLLDRWIPRRR
jgi:hypothetical protein